MENKIKRLVLYPCDIVKLTGRCNRTARKWITAIKKENNIKINRPVSVEEFCKYTGYDPVKVREALD